MTRILKITATRSPKPFFVPQWQHDGIWHEFFGFDSDSPYLHARSFDTFDKAKLFLEDPSIWKDGSNGSGIHATVVEKS